MISVIQLATAKTPCYAFVYIQILGRPYSPADRQWVSAPQSWERVRNCGKLVGRVGGHLTAFIYHNLRKLNTITHNLPHFFYNLQIVKIFHRLEISRQSLLDRILTWNRLFCIQNISQLNKKFSRVTTICDVKIIAKKYLSFIARDVRAAFDECIIFNEKMGVVKTLFGWNFFLQQTIKRRVLHYFVTKIRVFKTICSWLKSRFGEFSRWSKKAFEKQSNEGYKISLVCFRHRVYVRFVTD